jgi:hypothetical protein
MKRIQKIAQVKSLVEKQADGISGSVVSIWFDNITVGPLGLEKSKARALEKIQPIYNEVKTGRLTMEQAGKRIQADSSLAVLDSQYKANAYFTFSVNKGEDISFDKRFDAVLWNLKDNEISNIYLAQDNGLILGKSINVAYVFGQVTEKRKSGIITNFDDWLMRLKQRYATKIY